MKLQRKKQNVQQKNIWKNIAILLGIIIVLMIVGIILGVILDKKGEEVSEDSEIEKTELKTVAPTETEMTLSDQIVVSKSGAQIDNEKEGNGSNESHSYKVVSKRLTWSEAEASCEEEEGHLATVTSEEEFTKIIDAAESSGKKVLWLGAKRDASGQFQWITGEDFSYTSWLSGEPNNEGGNENYLVMFLVNDQWVWADVPGDLSAYYSESQVGYICEYNE